MKEEIEEIENTLKFSKPYNELGTYNYFNCESIEKLLEENKSLQFQLKAKEEVIKEARETIKTKLQKSFAYDYGLSGVDATGKDRLFTETVIELQLIDEILSKGENK